MSWSQDALSPWLAALKAGQVCAAPAEGVYGYVADPFNEKSLSALLALKKRDPSKGFICLIADNDDLAHLCPPSLSPAHQAAIETSWPCPGNAAVTLRLPAEDTISPLLLGNYPTLIVRHPATPYMQDYLQAWKKTSGHGVLISTSLNLSGEPPALSAAQIPADIPALTLSAPLSGNPSRILDPATGQWIR